MSERQITDNLETLFSFELLVEYIRIEKVKKASGELALGVRLLDFPTLLIYQPQQRSDDIKHQEQDENIQWGDYTFNRGKSCFFKMNLDSLHSHLCNTPLYAMVLDVKEEIPRLLGSSLISLAKVMDRIRQDVAEHGISSPSSHGERGLVSICNLSGEKIGSLSLSYKLLSLGASLLPHITDSRDPKHTRLHEGHHVQESIKEKSVSTDSLFLECGDVHSPTLDKSDIRDNNQTNGPTNAKIFINEEPGGDTVCVATEYRPKSQIPQTLQETENIFEEDLTIFCPPHLYYSNSAEEKSKNKGGDYKFSKLDSEAFTFKDLCSEDETTENDIEGPSFTVMHQKVRHSAKMSSNQETSGGSPNGLGEALQHLPLINALLVELSQLYNQNPHQLLSVHPNLAWIYRPASTEPSAGHGSIPQSAHAKSLQKSIQGTSPHFKHSHALRNSCTPTARPVSEKKKNKQEETLTESKSSSKSPRKKFVYGTTKTFNLRLKQIASLKPKRYECMEIIQHETQSSMVKGKTKSSNKIMKCNKRKSALNQSSSVNENIETMMQNIKVDSAQQEAVTLKPKNRYGKQDRDSLRISEHPSFSERDLKYIHIPTVDSDSTARNTDEDEHHSELDQSQCESDMHRAKTESSGSSRHSSPKSSFSDSSRAGNEEADYTDDFNSLEPSDACSPDPLSSPEPFRAMTPKFPPHCNFSNPDSGSESVRKRTVLPVPIKAPSSPHRTLRATYITRPQAFSFSSNDGDREGSAASPTISSRKQIIECSRTEKSSGVERFISSRGERSESNKTSRPVQGFSAESVSSFEPQEAEELEDDLGSLDFRKEYQHISELVATKLPGYTM